jgi:hypothetical protein
MLGQYKEIIPAIFSVSEISKGFGKLVAIRPVTGGGKPCQAVEVGIWSLRF